MPESEKVLDQKIRRRCKDLGGLALKFPAIHIIGFPDRMCLLPGGRVIFIEVKTTRKKPTKIQLHVHRKLKALGFQVEVVDNSLKIDEIL